MYMEDKMPLADGYTYSLDSSVTGINNNALIIGGSGCGKTWSIVEPRFLATRHGSLITVVSKVRIMRKYAGFFRNRGYKVRVINFANPGQSGCYDPMQYVKNDVDVFNLAETIVMADSRKQYSTADPYFDNAAESLLAGLIGLVREMEDPCFAKVLDLLDGLKIKEDGSAIKTNLDLLFSRLKAEEPESSALAYWQTFRVNPFKTAANIISTLKACTDKIFTSQIREMMGRGWSVDFTEAGKRKTVLFVVVDAVHSEQHTLVNMFYNTAIQELFNYAENMPDGRLPVPVSIIWDDFAVGARMEAFPQYISIFREKGISATLLLQSLSQLRSMYGNSAAVTIVNNCDTQVYMGGMDLDTADEISRRVNRPLEDILYMPVGKLVIMRRGTLPVFAGRYNLSRDPLYQKVTKDYESQITGLKEK